MWIVSDGKYINKIVNIAKLDINFGYLPFDFKKLILIIIIIIKLHKLSYNTSKIFQPIVFLNILIEKAISRLQIYSIASNFIHSNQIGSINQ